MGSKASSPRGGVTCEDCSAGRVHFLDEDDLDAHAMSVHWCQDCVAAHRQPAPFASYRELQEHILCGCASLSGLASRTRGMSIYDTSTSSHNIRKRFLPESFEGHQYAGLSTEFNPNDGSNATHHKRNNWSVGSSVDLTGAGALDLNTPSDPQPQQHEPQPQPDHCYYFDVVVPGSQIFEEGEVMGAATTICLEAATQILRGRSVSKELCDEIIQEALASDEAERNRSISAVYMRPKYRDNLEVLVDKRGCTLVSYVEPGERGYPSGRFSPSGSIDSIGYYGSLSSSGSSGSSSSSSSNSNSNSSSSHGRTDTVLPPDWNRSVDEEGSKVYSHETSGVESYERPPGSLKPTSFKVPKGVGSWGAPVRPGSVDAAVAAARHRSPRGLSRSGSVETNVSSSSSGSLGSGQLVQCFNMTSIFKLQEYSKTQPLVTMLSRSPNTSLLLFFDPQGRATVFLPFVESCSNCAFFGFDTNFDDEFALEALQMQLQEEFPVMTEADAVYSLRKHWNEFRLTVFRLDRSVQVEGGEEWITGDLDGDDDELGGGGYSTVREESGDRGAGGRGGDRDRGSRATFMTDLDGHFRPSVMGIFSGDEVGSTQDLGDGGGDGGGEQQEQDELQSRPHHEKKQKRTDRHSRLTSTDLRVRVEAFRTSSMSSITISPRKLLSPQKSSAAPKTNKAAAGIAQMPSLSSAMLATEKPGLHQLSQVLEDKDEEEEEDDTTVYSTDRGTFSSSVSSPSMSHAAVVAQLREENDELKVKLEALTEEMIDLRRENAKLRGLVRA